jgi:hypothetical protein
LFLEIEDNVFARAVYPHDPLALKHRGNQARWRLERLLPRTDPDRLDGVPGHALVEASGNGFNFGEFGHTVRIQDA